MGVHGITKLLKERGWLPSKEEECCSTRLWNDWNPSMAYTSMNEDKSSTSTSNSPSLQPISPESKFLIDGNGLAFHLHRVAYARHIRDVAAKSSPQSCPLTSSLSTEEITKVLPCMLPLGVLKQVTMEFVATLRKHGIRLQVFWDGPKRRCKARTNEKRRRTRQQEWGTLQQYCLHGSMPKERNACQWNNQFPYSALFLTTVRHALQISFVDMVGCQEEADVELALRASGDPTAYVIGLDSDFFFYKDIQYIPLDCIYLSQQSSYSSPSISSSLQAFCATRSELAQFLGLEDEEMVELAILMGNDYVDPATLSIPGLAKKHPREIIAFLREQEDGFLVEASKVGLALEYVRCLYNLHNLDRFPVDGSFATTATTSDDDDQDTVSIMKEIETVISFPTDFPMELARLFPEDQSVRDAVIRCLQAFIDQPELDSGVILKQEHLDAYKTSTMPNIGPNPFRLEKRRPLWNDIRGAHVIETCVSRILKSSSDSFLARGTPPDSLMNHIQFHAILATVRGSSSPDNEDDAGYKPTIVAPPEARPEPEERLQLPIDEHQENIVETIKNNRVTIIHGETGCGKSSRVPIMLLEAPSPEPSLPRVKLFMSQPRRIAAKGLVERVRDYEPEHRDKFALRMGHGWREYETNKTQAWFVTTGYLTRLLANHPEKFDDCTHLIIDEVHERSVDTDILCLLCRRLLERNKTIRLVLMSATLATKLYQDYFNVPNDPIHVGVRCFPIEQYFVEDLKQFNLPKNEAAAALAIQRECESKRCNSAPSQAELTKRFSLAARLTTIVGTPGSSVLIFVPGMNEIVSITECIENFYIPGVKYTCYPIHSDIPFDEQMDAFKAPAQDEVKVIIATNAAESSVTLPAVDHVICLGLCRQIMYNQSSHRQVLTPCWISRASATQRAGRTGRVRPGNVYRLYTRHAFESYMEEFEAGEMVRIPLDSVILMLKQMLHEEVKPVLQACIEPPPMETIDRSFQSLHRWNFISEPDDLADITTLGSFVSSLGIDLSLGSLIGLGIQFGVAAEAIEMAATMSFPKTPFQISNPLYHEPAEYNEITSKAFISKCNFDANLYSEPLALMNVLWDYQMASNKAKWCMHYRIAMSRMSQLYSTRNSLRKRVAEFLGVNEDKLQVEGPPAHMPHTKITILRLLKVWVFSDTIIECPPMKIKNSSNGSATLSLKGNWHQIEQGHLNQVLESDRHPHKITTCNDIELSGDFDYDGPFDLERFVTSFEKRLISYMSETKIDLVCCYDKKHFFVYVNEEKIRAPAIRNLLDHAGKKCIESSLQADYDSDTKRRGVLERKCGMWSVSSNHGSNSAAARGTSHKVFRRGHVNDPHAFVDLCNLMDQALVEGPVASVIFWEFPPSLKKKKKKNSQSQSKDQMFSVILRGECNKISKMDMQDLLGTVSINCMLRGNDNTQSVTFFHSPSKPLPYNGKDKDLFAIPCVTETSSWNRPLFQDIPEGARLMAVLASGQRKGGLRIRFAPLDKNAKEETFDISLKKDESDLSKRWKRLGTDSGVFVQENTVPASATHLSHTLFACSSNALELKGGGMKVEGLTLLPTNPLFLLLSFLSFGLEPNVPFSWDQMGDEEKSDEMLYRKSVQWLRERLKASNGENGDTANFSTDFTASKGSGSGWNETDAKGRIRMAIEFHKSCSEMGEELVCFPNKIDALCKLFKSVDGYDTSRWESLEEKALTSTNLRRWQQEKKTTYKSPRDTALNRKGRANVSNQQEPPVSQPPKTTASNPAAEQGVQPKKKPNGSKIQKQENKETNASKGDTCKCQTVRTFSEETKTACRQLFATELQSGEQLSSSEFHSTNILSLLFQVYTDEMLDETESSPGKRTISLNAENWEILSHEDRDGSTKYHARFINDLIPVLPIFGRGKNRLPKWTKKHMRPQRAEDAQSCVPPNISCPKPNNRKLLDRLTLFFDSIEAALRMEAAFYLERQFCFAGKSATRHWYDHNFQEMVQLLRKHNAGAQTTTEDV
jgi:HrpA-like RNA helicase